PDGLAFHLGCLEGALAEAYFRVGKIKECGEHGQQSLAHFGVRIPEGRVGWLAALAGQMGLRFAQAAWHVRTADPARSRRVASEIVRVNSKMLEVWFFSLRVAPVVWSTLRVVNHCEPAGPLPDLARGYLGMGVLVGLIPIPRLADAWCRRALEIAEKTSS